jgi:hypothetical protein
VINILNVGFLLRGEVSLDQNGVTSEIIDLIGGNFDYVVSFDFDSHFFLFFFNFLLNGVE